MRTNEKFERDLEKNLWGRKLTNKEREMAKKKESRKRQILGSLLFSLIVLIIGYAIYDNIRYEDCIISSSKEETIISFKHNYAHEIYATKLEYKSDCYGGTLEESTSYTEDLSKYPQTWNQKGDSVEITIGTKLYLEKCEVPPTVIVHLNIDGKVKKIRTRI